MRNTTHKGKSIKELVASRLSGYKYRRLPADVNDYINRRPSLQQIAGAILERNADKLPDIAFEMQNKRLEKTEKLHQAIIENQIREQSPIRSDVKTPTMLKKLNPSQESRNKALREVAKAQTHALKDHMAKEMNQVLGQASRSFTRVPRSIARFGN